MTLLSYLLQDLSPCAVYMVERYVLMFSEVANSFGGPLYPVFNVSRQSDDRQFVSLTLTPDDGLFSGRQYHVSIIAINTAGSSTTNVSLCEWRSFTLDWEWGT